MQMQWLYCESVTLSAESTVSKWSRMRPVELYSTVANATEEQQQQWIAQCEKSAKHKTLLKYLVQRSATNRGFDISDAVEAVYGVSKADPEYRLRYTAFMRLVAQVGAKLALTIPEPTLLATSTPTTKGTISAASIFSRYEAGDYSYVVEEGSRILREIPKTNENAAGIQKIAMNVLTATRRINLYNKLDTGVLETAQWALSTQHMQLYEAYYETLLLTIRDTKDKSELVEFEQMAEYLLCMKIMQPHRVRIYSNLHWGQRLFAMSVIDCELLHRAAAGNALHQYDDAITPTDEHNQEILYDLALTNIGLNHIETAELCAEKAVALARSNNKFTDYLRLLWTSLIILRDPNDPILDRELQIVIKDSHERNNAEYNAIAKITLIRKRAILNDQQVSEIDIQTLNKLEQQIGADTVARMNIFRLKSKIFFRLNNLPGLQAAYSTLHGKSYSKIVGRYSMELTSILLDAMEYTNKPTQKKLATLEQRISTFCTILPGERYYKTSMTMFINNIVLPKIYSV